MLAKKMMWYAVYQVGDAGPGGCVLVAHRHEEAVDHEDDPPGGLDATAIEAAAKLDQLLGLFVCVHI